MIDIQSRISPINGYKSIYIHQLSRNSFNKASNFVHAIGLVNKSTIYHSETLNIGHLKPDEGDFEFHALMCFVKKKLSDDAKSIIAWTSSVPTYQQRAAVYPRANICMSHSYSFNDFEIRYLSRKKIACEKSHFDTLQKYSTTITGC